MKLSEETKNKIITLKKYLDIETEEIERGKLFGEMFGLEKVLPKIEQLEKENEEFDHKIGNLLEQLAENNEILKRDYGVGFSTVEENEYFLEKFKDRK